MTQNLFEMLPTDVQKTIAEGAGLIMSEFDPASPIDTVAMKKAILFATSGGVNASCTPSLKDWGEDIDNCIDGAKELQIIEKWDVKLSASSASITPAGAEMLLASVEKTTPEEGYTVLKPKRYIDTSAFKDLWLVCSYGVEGGYIAIKISNAFSTGGFNLQTTDKEKGKFTLDFTGYASIETPNVVPFEAHIREKANAPAKVLELNEVQA